MKQLKYLVLAGLVCMVVVSFSIPAASAVYIYPTYDDGNCSVGAYYNLQLGRNYAKAYTPSKMSLCETWAWVGIHFTASATDTYKFRTSTILRALVNATRPTLSSYAFASVQVYIRCWRILGPFYFHVKSVKIFEKALRFFSNPTEVYYPREYITDRMYADLVRNCLYCVAVEFRVAALSEGRVCLAPGQLSTKAQLDVRWISYEIANGGGGGCPILSVYDGEDYVNEGLLDIHNPEGLDVTAERILSTRPERVGGRYLLRLTEHPQTISHIDQVKLLARLRDGTTVQLSLLSAIHSTEGQVKWELHRSDDNRVDVLGADHNNGASEYIDLEFVAPRGLDIIDYIFIIEGNNVIPKY